MIDRHGEAIEADLQSVYGLDLLDFFRNKYSWARLERLLGKMPPRSRYALALAEDDEFAEAMMEQDDTDDGPSSPSLADWSPEVNYIAALFDRMGEMIAAQIVAAGGKAPKVRPLPRPQSAFDRVRDRRKRGRHISLLAEVEEAQERFAARRSGEHLEP